MAAQAKEGNKGVLVAGRSGAALDERWDDSFAKKTFWFYPSVLCSFVFVSVNVQKIY